MQIEDNCVLANFKGLKKYHLLDGVWWCVKQIPVDEWDANKALLCAPVDAVTFDEVYQIA